MAEPDGEPIAQNLYCRNCGYNLRGLTENRCPECGEPFDSASLRYQAPASLVSPWLEVVFGALALAGAYPFSCCTSGLLLLPAIENSAQDDLWLGIAFGLSLAPITVASGFHARRLSRSQLERGNALPRRLQSRSTRLLWWLTFFAIELTLTMMVFLGGGTFLGMWIS